jgi:hypothetical protein
LCQYQEFPGFRRIALSKHAVARLGIDVLLEWNAGWLRIEMERLAAVDRQTRVVVIQRPVPGQYRLLLCDGHDSHISGNFVTFCIENDIVLLILLPHASHLIQPLDVGLFGPLKTAISVRMDRLIRTGIAQLRKDEWVEVYSDARKAAFTFANILAEWRGAGVFPLNRVRVLRQLRSIESTPPPPSQLQNNVAPFHLITSSPLDTLHLQSANTALK